MTILKDVSLKLYSTMRLGGTADSLVEVKTKDELNKAVTWAEERQLPVRMIGIGSNIIWRDEGFKGLVIVNRIKGLEKITENTSSATYKIGAGENWDLIVDQFVGLNLQGVECLSLIPGTVGATPVQNVGAYGQEIAGTFVSLEAYDRMAKDFVVLEKDQCSFGYRTSRFKTVDNGRFLICFVTLKLHRAAPKPPFYESLDKYFKEHKITKPTLIDIRSAVIDIRSKKLPDPAKVANNGSFFANPIIGQDHYKIIKKKFKDVVAWEAKDNYKISAAWLVEQAGFKGKKDTETGMSSWKDQALVFVNEKAQSTADLIKYQQKVTDAVYNLFQINLEREPELLP
ncbi:UDP-N-acetylmuramate dehydrogenase [Candidatus Saccharibacteria bacterium]|nr:UDP-N-acetylmuramate dehydrogenase [Candidatus Saccharibacteria bacterium]